MIFESYNLNKNEKKKRTCIPMFCTDFSKDPFYKLVERNGSMKVPR